MGVFNADGSWTSNAGVTYGADVPTGEYAPEDIAEVNADFAMKAPGSGGEGTQAKFGDLEGFLEGMVGGLGLVPKRVTEEAPGATLDTSQADASREGMDGLLAQLTQQAATGEGDWQNALKAATQRTQATAQAIGQSDPSMDAGGAAMNIANAQTAAGQRAAGQENILRSQSQAAGQGILADLLSKQGTQDIEQANAAARARQQVSATNLALIDEAQKNASNVKSGISQAIPFSDGGEVPGRARMFGNDERNDTEPAMLSPGEIVVDREHAKDPMSAAMRAFEIAMKAQGGAPKMAEGGGIGQYNTKDYGEGNAALSVFLPSIGQAAGYGNLRGKAGAGPPTIESGGKLDAEKFNASRDASLGLAKTIGGPRMSAAPQMTTNAADDAIAAALANRGASNAANMMAGVGAQQQAAGGGAAAAAGNEQARAQGLQGGVLTGQRGRDLSMALAQQQAGWANTMSNLGISLANQAALRGLFSGAGQAMTAASGAGAEKWGGYSSPGIEADAMGERGGPADLGGSDPDFKFEGGMIDGYAKGGRVEGKMPRMPQPKDRTRVNLRIGDVELSPRAETREERKAAEYEEETGDPMPAKRPKAGAPEKTIAQRLAEFAQRAAGSVSRMADGGRVFNPTPEQIAADRAEMRRREAFNNKNGPTYIDERGDTRDRETQEIVAKPRPRKMAYGGAMQRPSWPDGTPLTDAEIAASSAQPMATPVRTPVQPMQLGPVMTPQGAQSLPAATGKVSLAGLRKGDAPAPVVDDDPLIDFGSHQSLAQAQALGVRPAGEDAPAPAPAPQTTPAPAPRGGGGIALPKTDAMGRAFVNNEATLANEQMGEAAAASARAEVAGIEAKQAAQQQAALRMQATQDRARANTDSAMAKWQAAQDEFSRIDTKVESGRYWADKTTGQKILGVLGLALGAMGTGPDGINKAAQMMNQAIDRDIQLQKDAVERRLKAGAQRIEGAKTYYAMAREAGMDDLAATQAATAAGLGVAALAAERMTAATKEPVAKAMYAQYGAALRGAQQDKSDAAKQQTFANQLARQHSINETTAAGAKGAHPGATDRLKIADEVNTAALNIKTEAEQLKALIKQNGTDENRFTGPGVAKQMDLLSDSLATTMAKMQDPSTGVRDPEMERWSANVFRRGYTQTREDALAGLDNIIKAAESRRQNALRVRGMQ